MGNLISVLFSFLLTIPLLLFGVDLYALSAIKTHLETRATTLSYQISKEGGVRQTLVESLLEETIEISCFGVCEVVSSGQIVKFKISMNYTPIIIGREDFTISVTRTVMIGYL